MAAARCDSLFRPETTATVCTADERLAAFCFQMMLTDDERTGHGTGPDLIRNRRCGVLAQRCTYGNGIDINRVPSPGVECRLAVGDFGPAGDDDRRVCFSVAHDDDESDSTFDEREPPTVDAVPAELPASNRVADGFR